MKIIHIAAGTATSETPPGSLALAKKLEREHVVICIWLPDGRPRSGRKAMETVDAERPELVYCHGVNAARLGRKISKEYGIPYIAECCGTDLMQCSRRERRLFCCADACVADQGQTAALIGWGTNPARLVHGCQTACQLSELYMHTVRQYARHADGRRDGAVICGAYGKGNAGDDAILNAILHELRQADADLPVCVVSRQPEETRHRNQVQACHTFQFGELWRLTGRAAVFISGGGSLIQNATSSRSLYYYLMTLALARLRGCKVMMYGCGIGPVYGSFHRWAAARVIDHCTDVITLRDDDSVHELKRMGVKKPPIIRTADPTICIQQLEFGQTEKLLERLGIPRGGSYIGFGLREWKGFDRAAKEIAQAAQYAWQQHGLTPVFIPIEYPHDCTAAKKVVRYLRCPNYMIAQPMTISETISVLSRMSIVVGMRLHALIFSAESGVPSVGISYDMKVDGFLRSIGREDVTLHIQSVTGKQLMEQIDRAAGAQERGHWEQIAKRLTAEESENLKQLLILLNLPPLHQDNTTKGEKS